MVASLYKKQGDGMCLDFRGLKTWNRRYNLEHRNQHLPRSRHCDVGGMIFDVFSAAAKVRAAKATEMGKICQNRCFGHLPQPCQLDGFWTCLGAAKTLWKLWLTGELHLSETMD